MIVASKTSHTNCIAFKKVLGIQSKTEVVLLEVTWSDCLVVSNLICHQLFGTTVDDDELKKCDVKRNGEQYVLEVNENAQFSIFHSPKQLEAVSG